MTYEVWATTEAGEGHNQKIMEVEDVEDIKILCGMFGNETMISITEKLEKKSEDVETR